MEQELIKVGINSNNEKCVSGRELHKVLEIGTQYTKWFDRMCEYGFIENIDYVTISQKRLTAQNNETTYIDHTIKLDMAKEIAMIQRTEKGKQVRLYFIEIEKKYKQEKQLPTTYLEALKQLVIVEEQRIKLEKENKILSIENQHNKEIVKNFYDYTDVKPTDLIKRIVMRMAELSKEHHKDYQYFYVEIYKRYYVYSKIDLVRRFNNAKNSGLTKSKSVLMYAEEVKADKLLLNCVISLYKNASKQMYIEDLGFTSDEFEDFYKDLVEPLAKSLKLKPYTEWDEDSLTGFDRVK